MGTIWTFHNDRVKLYPDTETQGILDARLDFNQFLIQKINYFMGNPHMRSSMQFSVDFLVNGETQTSITNYSTDIAETQQYMEFIESSNYLFPLRYSASISKQQIAKINKTVIPDLNINDILWLNLRFFDGKDRIWFDNLNLPNKDKIYVAKAIFRKFSSQSKLKVIVSVPVFNQKYTLSTYDFLSCIFTNDLFLTNPSVFVEVNRDLCKKYPTLME